jgi:F-type H+-transporting ATPase subunit b
MKSWKLSLILAVLVSIVCASAALASGGSESPWDTNKLVWRVINTVVLLALLVYFLKQPLATFFSERKGQIQKDLDDARNQRDRAERLIKDYEQKIAGMEKELASMRADLAKSAAVESDKVMVNAERMAEKMVEAAKLTAAQEVRKAKVALKNEAVEMAVQLAETLIREKIDDEDRARIVEDYLAKVGGMK